MAQGDVTVTVTTTPSMAVALALAELYRVCRLMDGDSPGPGLCEAEYQRAMKCARRALRLVKVEVVD